MSKKLQNIGELYLIPTTLGDSELERVLPSYNLELVKTLNYFVVENLRTARRFLKKWWSEFDIDSLHFFELNKHTKMEEMNLFLQILKKGNSVGVISEAGCPAVADPGADVVALAHQMKARIIPLVGPSSILMALMGSGFNGQSFAFYGYLPIEQQDKIKTLKRLESRIYSENQTQIFIETPYRNLKLLNDIVATCRPSTKLCIATDISLETEFIATKSVSEWKKEKPQIDKRPTVFLIYK